MKTICESCEKRLTYGEIEEISLCKICYMDSLFDSIIRKKMEIGKTFNEAVDSAFTIMMFWQEANGMLPTPEYKEKFEKNLEKVSNG